MKVPLPESFLAVPLTHRGLHGLDEGCVENGISSFKAAISATGTTISPWGEVTRAQSPSFKRCSRMSFVGAFRMCFGVVSEPVCLAAFRAPL